MRLFGLPPLPQMLHREDGAAREKGRDRRRQPRPGDDPGGARRSRRRLPADALRVRRRPSRVRRRRCGVLGPSLGPRDGGTPPLAAGRRGWRRQAEGAGAGAETPHRRSDGDGRRGGSGARGTAAGGTEASRRELAQAPRRRHPPGPGGGVPRARAPTGPGPRQIGRRPLWVGDREGAARRRPDRRRRRAGRGAGGVGRALGGAWRAPWGHDRRRGGQARHTDPPSHRGRPQEPRAPGEDPHHRLAIDDRDLGGPNARGVRRLVRDRPRGGTGDRCRHAPPLGRSDRSFHPSRRRAGPWHRRHLGQSARRHRR